MAYYFASFVFWVVAISGAFATAGLCVALWVIITLDRDWETQN